LPPRRVVRRQRQRYQGLGGPVNASKLVFLSHSSIDTWVARQLANAIQQLGASTFLDEADVDLTEQPDEKIVKHWSVPTRCSC
jgi:hypothetical protein